MGYTKQADGFMKFDAEHIAKHAGFAVEAAGGDIEAAIGRLQIAVYVMAGGGFLGKFATEQPGAFYVDARVSKRPYAVKRITQAVQILAAVGRLGGYDVDTGIGRAGKSLPPMPGFGNLGTF